MDVTYRHTYTVVVETATAVDDTKLLSEVQDLAEQDAGSHSILVQDAGGGAPRPVESTVHTDTLVSLPSV